MKKLFRVALTSGDVDGIGPEVTAKALAKVKSQKGIQFYLWRSPHFPRKYLHLIDKHFRRLEVKSWHEALQQPTDFHKTLIDINSPLPPARWVEAMAKAGQMGSLDALVTAPLSKLGIIQAGMKDSGHTGILKRISKVPEIYMSFLGKHFNVVLLTGHTSIRKAYNQISAERLEHCMKLSKELRDWLPAAVRHQPIGVVGCNPHAGEGGVIDSKELDVFGPVLRKLNRGKKAFVGPLVPDVCFQDIFWKKYSVYVASYHDQGLIPFKMVHGAKSGIQISLGLPFVRTSVDHGTAKDIAGKDKADESSMKRAIEIAVDRLKEKPIKW
ncbi:MAG: 4-hydroxythreonine-4-phosphate dehydrogenase PdxA [Bdellovibrionales bacterium]|nr:4-hydroxythreonine-4-phosphate dehydrogenase PdxA [Bdellovibrionales bacterium]